MNPARYRIVIVAAMSVNVAAATAAAVEPVFPGNEWSRKPPETVGLDKSRLESMAEYVGGRGCVVRYGHMAFTWGDETQRGDVASACKPWYTHFLVKAIEDGKIKSMGERVVKHEPRLKELNAGLGYKDRGIQWKHLACQTSCYGVEEKPGTAYDYSDYNMALFFDTLFLKVYGTTWERVDEEVLHPRLTDVLGCQDNPTFMVFEAKDRAGRVGVSCRDFARFGLLYLRKGRWREKRLISAEHARLVTTNPVPNSVPRTKGRRAEMIAGQRSVGGGSNQTDHLGSYSYAWWTNGVDRNGKRHWPDVPHDAYGAFGHGGPRALVILPSLKLIVVWNGSDVRGAEKENRALSLLTSAVRGR